MSRRDFEKASEGGDACPFPAFLRAGRRIAEHPGAGRSARSAATVMHPVAPGFYVGARLTQIKRKSFQLREGGPERQMDPFALHRHRHAHRDPEQALGQRRWTAPAQHGGYREVLEPALHHAMKGMGQCAHPEPECVDVPEAAGASVQEQIVLLFLDPVFGLTPVAVHLFVDRWLVGLLERGDDEATVVPGFADRRTWVFRDAASGPPSALPTGSPSALPTGCPGSHSALAITRRSRLQLSRVR